MEFQDFKRHDTFAFESTVDLWGQKAVRLFVDVSPLVERDDTLRAFLPTMEEKLSWLDGHKVTVEKSLLRGGLRELAEDWIAGAEAAEKKKLAYITDEDFCCSLLAHSLAIYADKNKKDILMELYLICFPDYFAGHAIRVTIDGQNQVWSHGLAG